MLLNDAFLLKFSISAYKRLNKLTKKTTTHRNPRRSWLVNKCEATIYAPIFVLTSLAFTV